jgi:hypothetical protein
MHIEVGDHAAIDKLGLHEIAGKLDALGLAHLARDGELDFAGKLRVLALLERLDIVPEAFAVAPRFGRVLRQHDFAMDDAARAEIMVAVEALVVQPLARAIGRRRDGAAAGSRPMT